MQEEVSFSLPARPKPSLFTDPNAEAKANAFVLCMQTISQTAVVHQAAFDEMKKVSDEINLLGVNYSDCPY
jgi:hypothetical protein